MKDEMPPVRKFECQDCKYIEYRMSVREAGEILTGECQKCGGDLKVSDEEAPEWLVKTLKLVLKNFAILWFVAQINAKSPVQISIWLVEPILERIHRPALKFINRL